MSQAKSLPRSDSVAKKAPSNAAGISKLWKRMGLKMAADFCDRMGNGIHAGIDMVRLLSLETRSRSRKHRQALEGTTELVGKGETMAGAMKQQAPYFSPLLVQMVSAGEEGGRLDQVFKYMAEYYQDLKKTRSDFISQITLPAIQLGMALLIISGVILVIGLLAPSASDEPYDAIGLGLVGWSGFKTFWAYVFVVFALLTLVCVGVWQNWLNAHRILFPLIRPLPVIGNVFVATALSRVSIVLSLMLNAGVDARRAVRAAYMASGNHFFLSGLDESLKQVESNRALAQIFEAPNVFPREFIESLEVGELSGSETHFLEKLAYEYRERARFSLKQLGIFLSTGIWICIAGFIAFIVIRMFMQYVGLITSLTP